MEYIRVNDFPMLNIADGLGIKGGTAVTIGKFEGFHSGHQLLLKRILELEKKGLKSTVLQLIGTGKEPIISSAKRKELLVKLGINYFIECPLFHEIAEMTPEEFVAEIVVKQLHAKYLVIGADFQFGHNREGNSEFLKVLQEKYGYIVEVIEKKQYHGRDISSTYIREELEQGNIDTVNELLGHKQIIGEQEDVLDNELDIDDRRRSAFSRKCD